MKANELSAKDLMIGDWVCLPSIMSADKYPVQVLEIQDDCIKYYIGGKKMMVMFKYIEPIPLTPEILEKNGFVLESYSGNVMSGKWWTRNDFVIHENMNDSVGNNNFKYEYVYQLQHALRLCGIEKEIVL